MRDLNFMNSLTVDLRLKNINLNVLFPFVFIFIGFLGLFHHSLWRDEMQGWLVAWHSNTWIDLWKNNAPSGHPILWSALIYLIKGLTGTPLSMQLLQWFLASSAIVIFWKFNPLPIWQKALFTFGYFPFWEYYFISRHYVLAELLTFIFCATYQLRRKSYLPAAICIGLLTNTHAFAWAIAFAIFATLIIEWIFSSYQRKTFKKNNFWALDLLISFLIALSLVSFAAFSLMQVNDSASINLLEFDLRHLLRVFGRIFGGYLLIVPNYRNWLDLSICALIGGFMLYVTINFLRRSKVSLIFFLSGISSLFLFNYYVYLGIGSRHYGYYFLIFIASVWIALHPSENDAKSILETTSLKKKNLNQLFAYLLTFTLSVHFAAGIHRTIADFFIPYSAAKEAANYIKKNGWQNEIIFATRDVEVSTVSGYLGKELYYPELKGFGSYAKWKERKPIQSNEVLYEIQEFFQDNQMIDKFLLVLSRGSAITNIQNNEEYYKSFKISPIANFQKSWVDTERYYLYWAERLK